MRLSALKKIDLFGQEIKLRLNKDKSYKTACGTTMTLILSIITVIFIYSIGSELFKRANPSLI